MKTVFNYRLQNRTETCSRNTPRSSLPGWGYTPWVPMVGVHQRLFRQSCLLKPEQTNWSGLLCACASARDTPSDSRCQTSVCNPTFPKQVLLKPQNTRKVRKLTLKPKCVPHHYPVPGVGYLTRCALPLSHCPSMYRVTLPGAVRPSPHAYPCSALCHTPAPGRGYAWRLSGVNTTRRLRPLGGP